MGTTLGNTYCDTLTGYVGVATARTEYFGGRFSVCLERLDSGGKIEEAWLPEARLVEVATAGQTRSPGF